MGGLGFSPGLGSSVSATIRPATWAPTSMTSSGSVVPVALMVAEGGVVRETRIVELGAREVLARRRVGRVIGDVGKNKEERTKNE